MVQERERERKKEKKKKETLLTTSFIETIFDCYHICRTPLNRK